MPHKHTRRKADDDNNFDLAPSVIAKPLPTHSNASRARTKQVNGAAVKRKQQNHDYKHDDTPRAFARLMQFQSSNKRQRSGLDDGDVGRSAKRQRKNVPSQDQSDTPQAAVASARPEVPKILPGERLGDFAARVDHALPIGGLKTKGKVKIEGLKERQTKKEKKMQKMYAAWREEDARQKEKLEEQKELAEDAEAELDSNVAVSTNSKRKKREKDDEDPWAGLKSRREERKGLHDVVQAPPSFKALPREKFKVKNGARVNVSNVPSTSGSLKRREELEEARKEVIARYREMARR